MSYRPDHSGRLSCEDLSNPQLSQNVVFHAVHSPVLGVGSIVETAQVQESVKAVEEHFMFLGGSAQLCLTPCLGDADINLTTEGSPFFIFIDREGQHIGRRGEVHELIVQSDHAAVANKYDGELLEGRSEIRDGLMQVSLDEWGKGFACHRGNMDSHALCHTRKPKLMR
jgi:hypothetical protein